MATDKIGVIYGISVGSYGQTIIVTLKDLDGVAQDISAYDGNKYAIALDPTRRSTVQATATFTTDGTDGKVQWSWADGDMSRAGDWLVQIVLNKSSGGRAKTYVAKMPVIRQLLADTDIV